MDFSFFAINVTTFTLAKIMTLFSIVTFEKIVSFPITAFCIFFTSIFFKIFGSIMPFIIILFQYRNELTTNKVHDFSFIFNNKVLINLFILKNMIFRISFSFFTNVHISIYTHAIYLIGNCQNIPTIMKKLLIK